MCPASHSALAKPVFPFVSHREEDRPEQCSSTQGTCPGPLFLLWCQCLNQRGRCPWEVLALLGELPSLPLSPESWKPACGPHYCFSRGRGGSGCSASDHVTVCHPPHPPTSHTVSPVVLLGSSQHAVSALCHLLALLEEVRGAEDAHADRGREAVPQPHHRGTQDPP